MKTSVGMEGFDALRSYFRSLAKSIARYERQIGELVATATDEGGESGRSPEPVAWRSRVLVWGEPNGPWEYHDGPDRPELYLICAAGYSAEDEPLYAAPRPEATEGE